MSDSTPQPQTAAYEFDFEIAQDSKAVQGEGDLYIEGIAADWQMDRMDEAFEPGAFDDGIKAFMEGNPILCFHHQYDKALGQVVEMDKRPDGLHVKARVDKPARGSWAEDVFEKIKRGTIRAFSVGGKWHRRKGPDGRPRIYKADLAELSVTPLAVNQRTLFALAGKAFGAEGKAEEGEVVPEPAEPGGPAPEAGVEGVDPAPAAEAAPPAADAGKTEDAGCADCGDHAAELDAAMPSGPVPPEQVEAFMKRIDTITQTFDRVETNLGAHPMEATADQIEAAPAGSEGKAAMKDSFGQRRKWASEGVAMKDGSFPITHCGNDAFSNGAARRRAHQGSASESAILAHIAKREKALGCKSPGD